MFAMFDLTASLLVLLGFLIFRWAVIAAPILGTIGLLRPASAGIRRLAQRGRRRTLQHRDLRHRRGDLPLRGRPDHEHRRRLPGWLQVVLVWLCGVVGWLLLRPYRRITQLGGKDSAAAIAGGLVASALLPRHARGRQARGRRVRTRPPSHSQAADASRSTGQPAAGGAAGGAAHVRRPTGPGAPRTSRRR